jgi:hypothetical protein
MKLPKWRKVAKVAKVANFFGISLVANLAPYDDYPFIV